MSQAGISRWARSFRFVLILCAVGLSLNLQGQPEQGAAAGAADSPPLPSVELPGVRELASALADPDSRPDALLTLVALSAMNEEFPTPELQQVGALTARFLDYRAWLERLAARFADPPSRATVFDPAAWFIQQELGQHAIIPDRSVSPLGPPFADLLARVFSHREDALAEALLPEVLFKAEFHSTPTWQSLLDRVPDEPALAYLLGSLNQEWFDPWVAAEPPAPLEAGRGEDIIETTTAHLRVLLVSALLPEPPDALRLKRLRFDLLSELASMSPDEWRSATHVLALATAADRLHAQDQLAVIQSLLWVASDLLDQHGSEETLRSAVPALLVDYLPRLSNLAARSLAEVDAHFNASLAAAFSVFQDLRDGQLGPGERERLQQELADSVSQMVMLVPKMGFYFDQPVRQRVSEEIDICISVAADRDAEGGPAMTRGQFDGCLESMAHMAEVMARNPELSGDARGPFGTPQLERELQLTPWQRINYTFGLLHDQPQPGCTRPAEPLPNPLEWAAVATLMSWFAAQQAVFLRTPATEERIRRVLRQGNTLSRTLSQQADCISGARGRMRDPVSQAVQRYREAEEALLRGIREAELAFRSAQLAPGADVVLGGPADQKTAYRSPGLQIAPCDAATVCEMQSLLEPTRALIGLFPDPYLLADQSRLGSIEICYDKVQWVERRTEHVRPNDPDVGNYFGRLSFELMGRYREGGEVTPVFGARFVSPDEYNYLFAAWNDAILQDGCPVEWFGSRIVTRREGPGSLPVVPNRLTFLASVRTRPSEVFQSNWSRGAEWRDWFVTGIGVEPIVVEPDDGITERLAQHLRGLYQAEQRAVYGQILQPPVPSAEGRGGSLYHRVGEVTMYKSLIRAHMVLFYPRLLLDSNELRSALEGTGGLLDATVLERFRDNGYPIGRIREIGESRLQQFQAAWNRQPEPVVRSGTADISVAHGIARLETLLSRHFQPSLP